MTWHMTKTHNGDLDVTISDFLIFITYNYIASVFLLVLKQPPNLLISLLQKLEALSPINGCNLTSLPHP